MGWQRFKGWWQRFKGFDAESSLVVDVEALMKLILVSLQFTFVGMIVFALTFLVTVVPDAEPTRDAVRIGSLISTIVLAAANAFLLRAYRRSPDSRLFTSPWPALIAEAIWLLLAALFVVGAVV